MERYYLEQRRIQPRIIFVLNLILQISFSPESKGIYNIASGINISNKEILDKLSFLTGAKIVYSEFAEKIIFPKININRIRKEFSFKPTGNVIDLLPGIIENFKPQMI